MLSTLNHTLLEFYFDMTNEIDRRTILRYIESHKQPWAKIKKLEEGKNSVNLCNKYIDSKMVVIHKDNVNVKDQ